MIRCLRAGVVAALLMFGAVVDARAEMRQEPGSTGLYELVLRDGSRVYGAIEKETPDEVVLRTPAGVLITAQRTQVISLQPARGRLVRGEFQPTDPNTTRLFFAPTARSLKKGETYFGLYELIMPSLQVGITDRISIGGGTPLLFFGDGDWERPFWVTPKVQLLDTGRVQLAGGAFHAFDSDGDGGGIAYGVATAGSLAGSVTGGAGIAYAVDGGRTVLVMIGADRQISRSVKLVTENYVWRGGNGIASFGLRFFGERLSADVGLAMPLGEEAGYAFPVVNFVYLF